MKQKIFLMIALLMGTLAFVPMHAEELTFTADAPSAVIMGERFRLSYTITTNKTRDFRIGDIVEFDILSGPNLSSSSNISIINGVRTSVKKQTYTYILRPKQEGTFTIPAATIVADGNQMQSNEVTIKVLPPDQPTSSAQQNGKILDKDW